MYKCQLCGKTVGPKQAKQVLYRYVAYEFPHRRSANKQIVFENGKKKIKWVDDKGGRGQQIAAEVAVCQECKRASERPT